MKIVTTAMMAAKNNPIDFDAAVHRASGSARRRVHQSSYDWSMLISENNPIDFDYSVDWMGIGDEDWFGMDDQ